LDGKADKTAVVSSFNSQTGDVQLKTGYGLSISVDPAKEGNGAINVIEDTFGIKCSGLIDSTVINNPGVFISNNTLHI
jgi:hypothetical protein